MMCGAKPRITRPPLLEQTSGMEAYCGREGAHNHRPAHGGMVGDPRRHEPPWKVLSEPEPRIRETARRAVNLFLTTYDPTLYIGEQIAMYCRTDDGREGSHQGGKQAPGATHQVETVAARPASEQGEPGGKAAGEWR